VAHFPQGKGFLNFDFRGEILSLIRSISDQMEKQSTSADMWKSAISFLPKMGLSKVVFMDLSSRKTPLVLSNASDAWTTNYRAIVKADRDPFARNCLTRLSSQPTGIGHLEHHQHLPQEALDQIAKGSDALNISIGMSVTLLPDAQGAGVGFNLLNKLKLAEFAELRMEFEDTWRAWCQLAYAGLNMSNDDGPTLTVRERDCLAFFADGMRTAQVAYKLGISEGTVELHLRNARERLKAKTRDQAVALAVRAGMI
jgi:DNA-binding CsgD family transcriptional regulator